MGELEGLRGISLVGSGPFALDYCCDWSGLESLALICLDSNGLTGPAPEPAPASVGFYSVVNNTLAGRLPRLKLRRARPSHWHLRAR